MTVGTGAGSAGGRDGGGGRRPRAVPPPPWGDADPVDPPPDVRRRHGVIVLDPATAVRFPGQELRPTPYLGDRLLVPFSLAADEDRFGRLREALGRLGLRPERDERRLDRARYLSGNEIADVAVPVRLVPESEGPSRPPDAWEVLQTLRSSGDAPGVALDHLAAAVRPPWAMLSVVDAAGGAPGGNGYTPSGRTRMPVTLPVHALPRAVDDAVKGRRPVVAVLDTGCGKHPWLPDGVVRRGAELDGEPVGRPPGTPDPESTGDVVGPLDGALDWVAGHGTFVAGVVRQVCPDADLLSVPVVHADGVVPEGDVLQALTDLLVLATRHARGEDGGTPVDVVVLSLGYYPEEIGGDAALRSVLDGFGRIGVAVVAAAGNESTVRPLLPAAFAGAPADAGCVPVTSVGALNPDGSVALFSNAGEWVTAWAPGALLVSTLPVTFGTAARASTAFDAPLPGDSPAAGPRAAVDPEDFSGGFGVWSGTSFAAPWVAGLIAARLLAGGLPAERDPAARVKRGWAAVSAVTGVTP